MREKKVYTTLFGVCRDDKKTANDIDKEETAIALWAVKLMCSNTRCGRCSLCKNEHLECIFDVTPDKWEIDEPSMETEMEFQLDDFVDRLARLEAHED
jgi:hypothetical protein